MRKLVLILVILISSSTVSAKKLHDAEKAKADGLVAVTVFFDISILGRKDRAAKRMTKMHQKYAQNGYILLDVSPYTENGDLQGFYVSYVEKDKTK